MDPILILQTTLAGIMSGMQFNSSLVDVAQNDTSSAASTPLNAPLNLSTLFSFLLSLSALQDWLKILVIGGAIEASRRTGLRLWYSVVELFWITACFDDRDASYSESSLFTVVKVEI